MAELRIADGVIGVEDTAQADHEGRAVFEWRVALDSGAEWTGEDLKGPAAGREPSEADMLATLLHFMAAAVEAREYRERTGREAENEDLFPADLVTWLCHASSELEAASMDMEESL